MSISDDELLNESELLKEVEKVEQNAKPVETTDSDKTEVIEPTYENAASKYIGTQLTHKPGEPLGADKEKDQRIINEKKLTRIGESITTNADYRDGWIDVDRRLLGERDIFYPSSWRFRIRPATVEAIRQWSTLDDENANSVDDVFTEILKSCVSIVTDQGPIPVGNICSWDRFFFLLLVREYTFIHGEAELKYEEDCIECDNPVTFKLTSTALMYEMPDPEVMPLYDQETRCWNIDPADYDVHDQDPIKLYVPTVEKDANIKAWIISRLQENRNRKIDQVFIRFLMWLAPKISKDTTIAQKQIREYEMIYKSWDTDMFGFMDDVVRNIIVNPSTKLTATCPVCGEEMTSDIRFPNSIRDLFNVQNRFKKFGKK